MFQSLPQTEDCMGNSLPTEGLASIFEEFQKYRNTGIFFPNLWSNIVFEYIEVLQCESVF